MCAAGRPAAFLVGRPDEDRHYGVERTGGKGCAESTDRVATAIPATLHPGNLTGREDELGAPLFSFLVVNFGLRPAQESTGRSNASPRI